VADLILVRPKTPSTVTAGQENSLTPAGLIRFELTGKNVALGRYDSILWKIRSGYVVVLYGALSLIFGKAAERGVDFAALNTNMLLLISGFSLLGYFVDISFRIRQLRVVAATNLLADQALKLATGEAVDRGLLRELLQIAGESRRHLNRRVLVRAILLIFVFYAATPLLAATIRFAK
jgi:hypothetical protein